MKLEEQVCSLELARRLKELGVSQNSLWNWQNVIGQWEPTSLKKEYIEKNNSNPETYSAFSAIEIATLLPPNINNWGLCFDATSCLTQDGIKNIWHATYADYDKKMFNEVSDLNLANCCAKLLIHLLENGIIKND